MISYIQGSSTASFLIFGAIYFLSIAILCKFFMKQFDNSLKNSEQVDFSLFHLLSFKRNCLDSILYAKLLLLYKNGIITFKKNENGAYILIAQTELLPAKFRDYEIYDTILKAAKEEKKLRDIFNDSDLDIELYHFGMIKRKESYDMKFIRLESQRIVRMFFSFVLLSPFVLKLQTIEGRSHSTYLIALELFVCFVAFLYINKFSFTKLFYQKYFEHMERVQTIKESVDLFELNDEEALGFVCEKGVESLRTLKNGELYVEAILCTDIY